MIFGREHELAALNAAYAQMLEGHGSVLFLTGEAGLGKTTLVHAWAATRDTQPASLFLESACSIPIGNVDVGRLEALQPWADVVAQLHEEMSTLPTSKGTSQHKLNLGKLMRDSAPAWLWALPFVGEVAHAALVTARLAKDQRTGTTSQVHSPTGPDPSLAPARDNRAFAAANQEQVFQQYVNLLTKIAETTPLVIFLDDLHWADTSSCNLLFYLARQIAGKKILVIATYRQDDAARGSDGKGHAIITVKNEILRYDTGKELALSYLSRDAIRDFLSNTFTSNTSDGASTTYGPDETFEQWLHRISDGNSLFMSQFVRTLREDGHLNNNGKFIGDYATVAIPTSALAVVEERTRRLDADTRKLLMYATAEGEEFTTYVLERLTKKDPMALLDELLTATTLGLIAQRGTSRLFANTMTGIFGFSHALFHKALYDGLLDMQKQHLHEQCFQLLKSEWDRLSDTKDRTTTLATKLLAHATKCERWTTVAEVALAAAQEFWKAYNEGEAVAMIAKVIEASDAAHGLVAERAEALMLKGQISSTRGRYDEATTAFRDAEALFQSNGSSVRVVDAVNALALLFENTASREEAETEADRALQLARSMQYRLGEARALMTIGTRHSAHGAYKEALSTLHTGLTIFTEIGDRLGEANALNLIGIAHNNLSAYDESLSYYKHSLAIFIEIGDRNGEGRTLHNMGLIHSERRALDEALAHVQRSLAIFSAIGHRQFEANSLGLVGNVHYNRGEYDEALSHYEQSLAICVAIGSRKGEAIAVANIGSILKMRGEYDDALSYFERSLAIDAAMGNVHATAQTRQSIGTTLRLMGKLSEARHHLEQSLAIATESNVRITMAGATGELALLAEDEARTLEGSERDAKLTESIRLYEEVIGLCREMGLGVVVAEAEEEIQRIKSTQ